MPWQEAGLKGELHSLVWESRDLIALNRVSTPVAFCSMACMICMLCRAVP